MTKFSRIRDKASSFIFSVETWFMSLPSISYLNGQLNILLKKIPYFGRFF